MSEDFGISLADLAGLDVSEIQEIRFETLPQGIYDFKVVSATLEEGTNRDDEKRFWAEFKFEVLEAKAIVDKNVDRESLAGKTHGEKLYIVPEKAEEGIGRIRAFISDLGCENGGALGPIVENTKDHVFTGKITHQKDKSDSSIVYARLKLDSQKK